MEKRIQLNGNDIYKNPIKWYILSVICSIYLISIIVCRALDYFQGFYYLQRVKALKNKSLGSSSFMKLFGKEPGKPDSEADCYQEITRRLLEKNANDENDFVYIESELIQAIKHGGFCEIQEANIIKRSSVLEALNPLLANGGKDSFIKLPNGEVITRHPDCVIAFTVNREYEGCNDLQEAV